MSLSRWAALALASWMTLTLGGAKLAQAQQQPQKSLSDSLTGTAKTEYETAKLLFTDGDFAGAAVKFKSAYDKSNDARLLWNIASAEKSQRHYARTVALVRRYLDTAHLTDAEQRDARHLLDTLDTLTVRLTVDVKPAGAEVLIDGVSVGVSPLSSPVVVDLGSRRVSARKAGLKEVSRDVTLGEEKTATVSLSLEPEMTQSAPVEPSLTERFTVPSGIITVHYPAGWKAMTTEQKDNWSANLLVHEGEYGGVVIVAFKGETRDLATFAKDALAGTRAHVPGFTVTAQQTTQCTPEVHGVLFEGTYTYQDVPMHRRGCAFLKDGNAYLVSFELPQDKAVPQPSEALMRKILASFELNPGAVAVATTPTTTPPAATPPPAGCGGCTVQPSESERAVSLGWLIAVIAGVALRRRASSSSG
jgi:hypothetical protein